MSDTVNKPRTVEGLPVQKCRQIARNGILVLSVYAFFHILKHPHHLDVGAAVTRSLKRTERRCNGGISIGAGGGHDMRGEGRIVTAAVLGVQHQSKVEQLCFKR